MVTPRRVQVRSSIDHLEDAEAPRQPDSNDGDSHFDGLTPRVIQVRSSFGDIENLDEEDVENQRQGPSGSHQQNTKPEETELTRTQDNLKSKVGLDHSLGNGEGFPGKIETDSRLRDDGDPSEGQVNLSLDHTLQNYSLQMTESTEEGMDDDTQRRQQQMMKDFGLDDDLSEYDLSTLSDDGEL